MLQASISAFTTWRHDLASQPGVTTWLHDLASRPSFMAWLYGPPSPPTLTMCLLLELPPVPVSPNDDQRRDHRSKSKKQFGDDENAKKEHWDLRQSNGTTICHQYLTGFCTCGESCENLHDIFALYCVQHKPNTPSTSISIAVQSEIYDPKVTSPRSDKVKHPTNDNDFSDITKILVFPTTSESIDQAIPHLLERVPLESYKMSAAIDQEFRATEADKTTAWQVCLARVVQSMLADIIVTPPRTGRNSASRQINGRQYYPYSDVLLDDERTKLELPAKEAVFNLKLSVETPSELVSSRVSPRDCPPPQQLISLGTICTVPRYLSYFWTVWSPYFAATLSCLHHAQPTNCDLCVLWPSGLTNERLSYPNWLLYAATTRLADSTII